MMLMRLELTHWRCLPALLWLITATSPKVIATERIEARLLRDVLSEVIYPASSYDNSNSKHQDDGRSLPAIIISRESSEYLYSYMWREDNSFPVSIIIKCEKSPKNLGASSKGIRNSKIEIFYVAGNKGQGDLLTIAKNENIPVGKSTGVNPSNAESGVTVYFMRSIGVILTPDGASNRDWKNQIVAYCSDDKVTSAIFKNYAISAEMLDKALSDLANHDNDQASDVLSVVGGKLPLVLIVND